MVKLALKQHFLVIMLKKLYGDVESGASFHPPAGQQQTETHETKGSSAPNTGLAALRSAYYS